MSSFPVEMSHQPERALTQTFRYGHRHNYLHVEMSHQPERALTLIRLSPHLFNFSHRRNESSAREGIDTDGRIGCLHHLST